VIDALIDFLKAAPVLNTALLVAGYLAALAFAFIVTIAVIMPAAAAYYWYRNPQYRAAAVEARANEAQARLAAILAGGRRRAFLRRRAEREAARNPWRPA
jgi:hypothetical protein